MSNAEKWKALVKWVEDTKEDEDADIWDFLGDDLGVEPDGSREHYGIIEEKDEKEAECDCGCLDDEDDEEEYDTLDMKVLGFKTTERLNGNWNSLLFEIRNYGDDEEEEEKDECEGCEKDVVVEYEDCKGYTIANCDNCGMMLCRECLETGTAEMCKYCVVSVVENFAENLNSYPKEKVDKIIAMMKEDMGEAM